jgi:hypothetical protein
MPQSTTGSMPQANVDEIDGGLDAPADVDRHDASIYRRRAGCLDQRAFLGEEDLCLTARSVASHEAIDRQT